MKPKLIDYQLIFYFLLFHAPLSIVLAREISRLHINDKHLSKIVPYTADKATFKCAVSPSSAAVDWLLNGQLITPEDFRFTIDRSRITVKITKKSSEKIPSYHLDSPYSPQDRSGWGKYFVEKSDSSRLFGIIQCKAKLGHQILLSEPLKLIIAVIDDFHHHENKFLTVYHGNTAVIPCQPPHSVPIASTEFIINDTVINRSRGRYLLFDSGNLHIRNAQPIDSGRYRCVAFSPFLNEKRNASGFVDLKVLPLAHTDRSWANSDNNRALEKPLIKFTLRPPQHLKVIMGANVTLECVVESVQTAIINWYKVGAKLPAQSQQVHNNLVLFEVKENDSGEYVCQATADSQVIESSSNLDVQFAPRIVKKLQDKKLADGTESTFECYAKGNPKPKISWFFNAKPIDPADYNNNITIQNNDNVRITTDSLIISVHKSTLHLSYAQIRKHLGIFQCFASNELGTASSYARVKFRNSRHREGNNQHPADEFKAKRNRKRIHGIKLIPPNKPTVFRYDDSSVLVRWSLPPNDGLAIQFFKIQYEELGDGESEWQTVGDDISSNSDSYIVKHLISGSSYRFRIVAVYSNNDNREGPTSDRFLLLKNPSIQKPKFPPQIIQAVPNGPSTIQLWWDHHYALVDSVQINGYFIHYRAVSSAGTYHVVTIPSHSTNSFSISNLLPATAYEFKMQSFNEAGVSEFSDILQSKTLPSTDQPNLDDKEVNEIDTILKEINSSVSDGDHTLLIIVAAIVSLSFLVLIICTTLQCRRTKSEVSEKFRQRQESTLSVNSNSIRKDTLYSSSRSLKSTTGALSNSSRTRGSEVYSLSSSNQKINGSLPRHLKGEMIVSNFLLATEKLDNVNMFTKYREDSHFYSSTSKILSGSKELHCIQENDFGTRTASLKRNRRHQASSIYSTNPHQSNYNEQLGSRRSQNKQASFTKSSKPKNGRSLESILVYSKSPEAVVSPAEESRQIMSWKSCNFRETSL